MDAAPAATRVIDPFAIDGKIPLPDEHAQLLVVGGGPAARRPPSGPHSLAFTSC